MSIKLSKFLFFFIFIFAPLAFGTTESWSYAIMEVCTVLGLLFFLIHSVKHKETIVKVPALIPLILFLAYTVFQLVPLPPFLVKGLSHEAYAIHSTARLLCESSAWMPLSVNTKATLAEFFRYSTYIMFYVLTIQLLKEKTMLQATAVTIAVFGGMLAFSSILQFYLTDDMALWFRHSPNNSIVMGPYANHNHYAGLMEMIFPIVLGLFLFYRPRIGNASLIKGILQMLSQEKANIHILIGTSALLIVVSIFVSLSRGAMISTCLSLVVFTFLLLQRNISKGNTIFIIGLIMTAFLAIGWFGWEQIFERFARLKNAQGVIYESRLDFWKDTLDIIRHYALTGSGAGTFSHIYPLYRTIISDRFLTHAHNDYLELLAETGIIGFCLAAVFFIILVCKTYTVFSRRRDAFCIYVYIGAITAISAIGLHSFTDFNLRIGANGLWFFFIAGVMVSAANTGLRKKSAQTRLPEVAGTGRKAGFLVAVCILSAGTIAFNLSHLLGRFYYTHVQDYTISSNIPADTLKKIEKTAGLAALFDPLVSDYPFLKANTAWVSNEPEKAGQYFKTAVCLSPLNSRQLNRFAAFWAWKKEMEKAKTAYEKSMQYDPTNPEYTFQYAAFLLGTQNTDQGILYLKKVLDLDTGFMDRVLTLAIVSALDMQQLEQVIPPVPGPFISFANFLFDTGKIQDANDRYLAALDLLKKQEPLPFSNVKKQQKQMLGHYVKIFTFFKSQNDLKHAMQVMEEAEKKFPMDDGIKVRLGNLYYQQGIFFKAAEKYDQALLIQPDNAQALNMLKKINP